MIRGSEKILAWYWVSWPKNRNFGFGISSFLNPVLRYLPNFLRLLRFSVPLIELLNIVHLLARRFTTSLLSLHISKISRNRSLSVGVDDIFSFGEKWLKRLHVLFLFVLFTAWWYSQKKNENLVGVYMRRTSSNSFRPDTKFDAVFQEFRDGIFSYFWPSTKLSLNFRKLEDSSILRWNTTRVIIINHKGTRMVRMEKIITDYKRRNWLKNLA